MPMARPLGPEAAPDAPGPPVVPASALVRELLARCRFPPPGSALDCAVSGGADSLALMVLARAAGCQVTAIHVDHGLRPGSEGEAEIVVAAARRVGARWRRERVEVGPGPNLEARARAARLAVLPPGAATGHTADDQAETILLNLMRGSGLDGLVGMREGPRHPILELRRRETSALCAELGLVPVKDPSNTDPRHLRNRVRQEVLPLLEELSGRDLVVVLTRQAALLVEEADLLDGLAGAIEPTDAGALAQAPAALARRAVRRWLRDGDGHPPGSAAVGRVLAVARGQAVACEVAGGLCIRRFRGRLVVGRAGSAGAAGLLEAATGRH